jgi:hypothetical protein
MPTKKMQLRPEKAVVCLYIADHVDDKEQRLLFNL